MFQNVKNSRKIFSGLLVAGFGLLMAASSAPANIITGGISFNGNVTPYLSATGIGTQATDYINAHSLVFGPSVVSLGANGSFASIAAGTPVTMYSPLVINLPQFPIPPTSPLWSLTVGPTTYTFTLDSLTEPVDQASFMVLNGSGVLSDGIPADTNQSYDWIATFTTSGSTYSWNASSGEVVPEPASLGILGIGSLALLRRSRRR